MVNGPWSMIHGTLNGNRAPSETKLVGCRLRLQTDPLAPMVLRQIPIPYDQLDLPLERVPDLTVRLSAGLGLREALLGLPSMLQIGCGDPCPALLRPWTGRASSVQSAPSRPSDRGPLTFRAAPCLGQAPFARPVGTKAGGETNHREQLRLIFYGVAGSAVYGVI